MNDTLNKLFGRDFLVGFFLPALLFIVGSIFLLKSLGFQSPLLKINLERPLEDTGFVVVASLLLAVFLEAFNREIFRIAEGYWGPPSLRRWLSYLQLRRFRKLHDRIDQIRNSKIVVGKADKASLLRKAALAYPSTEDQVLPTSFGNAVRAYEDYSRVVYGFESIDGWSRIQALMSKEFRQLLGNSRARVDLWLNLVFLAILFLFEALLLPDGKQGVNKWVLLSIFLLAAFAYLRARSSVQEHGHTVKAAFDVYLPALAVQLGYPPPRDVTRNRNFWRAYSQLMVYRYAPNLGEMAAACAEPLPTPSHDQTPEGRKRPIWIRFLLSLFPS